MSINGLSSYGRRGGYLNPGSLPDPKKTYSIAYERLDGGLNISEVEYRLKANESPEMKNLLWSNGALGCRDGQTWLSTELLGVGYTCYPEPFWGHMFSHIEDKLYYADLEAETFTMTQLVDEVPEVAGTFFRYQDYLFYKTKGAYIRISYSATAPHFSAEDVPVYTPVTYLNCSPSNGSGDSYQPENRICSQKTLKYNAAVEGRTQTFAGDGTTKVFTLTYNATSQARLNSVESVYVGAALQSIAAYSVDLTAGTITFLTAPVSSAVITVVYTTCLYVYSLPVEPDSVDAVVVDGETLVETTDYTVDLTGKKITFTMAPAVTNPATNNTVVITYSKDNDDAYNSIMDCPYAIVYGGNRNVCIVLGGSEAQPNAYFWNGNNVSMDAGYFPMTQYNLAGDTEEAITGFGRQQNYLVILKTSSLGHSSLSVETVDGRDTLDLPYTEINSRIGCDCPRTIQLVENNLVWCNSEQGVCYLADSSSAYENNVRCLSGKVNSAERVGYAVESLNRGLLYDVRRSPSSVCSLDAGGCYWLVAAGNAYVWNYDLGDESNPSWFFFTNIGAAAFCVDGEGKVRHLNVHGQVTLLERSFNDYDEAIEKVYLFPAQDFDNYDRYKNVVSVVFTVRSDTDSLIDVVYKTDWEERADLTPILSYSWHLVPRNASYRNLGVVPFATVARRTPGCKNIRHFAMRLENKIAGNDLTVISAQIFYNLQGGQR